MLAVLTVASLVGAPPKSFFKTPMFYNNSDCEGDALQLSQNFSRMAARDRRWMNVLDQEYLPSWGTSSCLRVLTEGGVLKDIDRKAKAMTIVKVPSKRSQSVGFYVEEGDCASGGSVYMAMRYYTRHSNCGGEAKTYNLSAGQCRETPFGHVKWEPSITNHTELCTVQKWIKPAQAGRIVTWKYSGANCTGNHFETVIEPLLGDYCSQDTCDGCCPSVDSTNSCAWEKTPANVHRYEKVMQACTKVNGTDVFAMRLHPYQDEECTIPDHTTDLNRSMVTMGECANIETPAKNYSVRIYLSNIDASEHCPTVEIGRKHSLSTEWVTYEELVGKSSGAQAAVSMVGALLAVSLVMLQ